MKMIVVQTIIYDVYLARTGNCDIGTSHECETVGLKQYGTECVWNRFIAWSNNCKDNREQSNSQCLFKELCYILLGMNL